jgi:uncharacterized protein
MTQLETDGRFAEGIRLFNQGNFFEAHEVWEQAWKVAEGIEKIFYQGIIQAAAALLHIQRGSYAGAISVYLKSCPKLDQFPAVWMGIELGQFRAELARYFDTLRTSSDARRGNYQPAGAGQIAQQPPMIRWAARES